MEDALRQFAGLRTLRPWEIGVNVLDVALVTYLLYRLLILVRGTRAWRILLGVLAFLVLLFLSERLGLRTLHWLLDKATILGPVALVILFLPELRQAIEGFGKITPLQILENAQREERAEAKTVEDLVAAMAELSAESVGALVVVERGASLDEIASNGVPLSAPVSKALLGAIFYGENPLHDGAVIVRRDSIVAAACRLPLSESSRLDENVHMRHRAAVGVTEATDAIAIVVSEERGTISVAMDGVLRRLTAPHDLRELLNRELRNMPESDDHPHRRVRPWRRHDTEPTPPVEVEEEPPQ
ncbi:TIGR00159 family protein [bacterium]|nr:MAG: TIGR00159 family protein [bacterium]